MDDSFRNCGDLGIRLSSVPRRRCCRLTVVASPSSPHRRHLAFVASPLLPIASRLSPVARRRSPFAACRSPVARRRSPVNLPTRDVAASVSHCRPCRCSRADTSTATTAWQGGGGRSRGCPRSIERSGRCLGDGRSEGARWIIFLDDPIYLVKIPVRSKKNS